MELAVVNEIQKQLKLSGFKEGSHIRKTGFGYDISSMRIINYQLDGSNEYELELHVANYTHQYTADVKAVNILALLKYNKDDTRVFGASVYIHNEQGLREAVHRLLNIPVAKLKNAANPLTKCMATPEIRSRIFKHLHPKDAAKQERVCTAFLNSLLDQTFDREFWAVRYRQEYGDTAIGEQSVDRQPYRTLYIRKKRQQMDWVSFAARMPLIIPGYIPHRLLPLEPKLPRRPSGPMPSHPIQPQSPWGPPPLPPFQPPNRPGPSPPQPYGPDVNPFAGGEPGRPLQPIGDPLHVLPNRPQPRGGNPDAPDMGQGRGTGEIFPGGPTPRMPPMHRFPKPGGGPGGGGLGRFGGGGGGRYV